MVKIYVLIDPRNNEIRYVGQTHRTLKERYWEHVGTSRRGNNYCRNWINLLIKSELYPIIELVEEVDESDWVFWEKYWIAQFKCWGFNLTNLSIGGEGCFGVKRSEETKQKMRIIGKNRSKESIKKTIETRRKRGKYVWSEESKAKLSKSHTGKSYPNRCVKIFQYSLDGTFIKEWGSIKEATIFLNKSNSYLDACLAGKVKNVGGFCWKYKDK